ncbi:triphosphoribosyl-dephospho-CoA synthase CitG [Rhodoferax sp.]|uniref:triphosphoribosyl-dephospho-CoA synthase CitG n=1 Tax=Rhodoferax sp. TaxID=50421 RepID=UPI00284EA115|nr:triphosphoribosyl-dephospho-CoA synthase CitG [Rhodoferax sp.]MDR3371696.1 triphosphoribosyl-dephospho-CoA synthase CitG [Rhodoferax sp.]
MPFATALAVESPLSVADMARAVGQLASGSLQREMELTPKPGLVDQANSGAHHDMDLSTFQASLAAIAPWFPVFFQQGAEGCQIDARAFLSQIRGSGLDCERAMLAATGGVNTHKGSVFSLGLLCAAAGRVFARGEALACDGVAAEVALICADLVQRDMRAPAAACSAGERLYWQYGLKGARGEAQSGFAIARAHGVVPYQRARTNGMDDERALLEALLHLMAHNPDTNLVSRGGASGLRLVQMEARRLLARPCPATHARKAQLAAFDKLLIEHHLSPGGSADLLAVSWFLANLDNIAQP